MMHSPVLAAVTAMPCCWQNSLLMKSCSDPLSISAVICTPLTLPRRNRRCWGGLLVAARKMHAGSRPLLALLLVLLLTVTVSVGAGCCCCVQAGVGGACTWVCCWWVHAGVCGSCTKGCCCPVLLSDVSCCL